MITRIVSIDEHQLMVCLKYNLWGSSKNNLKNWSINDKLYVFEQGFLAAVGKVKGQPYESDLDIWSEEKLKYKIPIEFTYYFYREKRELSAKKILFEDHNLKNYGMLLRDQGKISSTIVDDIENKINDEKNSIDSIKNSIDLALKTSFQLRLLKTIENLRKLASKDSFTKKSEIARTVDPIFFLELLNFKVKNNATETTEINDKLSLFIKQYDEMNQKKSVNDDDYAEILKKMRLELFSMNNFYKLFAETFEQFKFPVSHIHQIAKQTRTMFKEIEYAKKNKYIGTDILKALSDSYNRLFEEQSSLSSELPERKFGDHLNYLLNIITYKSNDNNSSLFILDVNNDDLSINMEINKFKKNNAFFHISDVSNEKLRYKALNYITNGVHWNNLVVSQEYDENVNRIKGDFDVLILDVLNEKPHNIIRNFMNKILYLKTNGLFICLISKEFEIYQSDDDWKKLRQKFKEEFSSIILVNINGDNPERGTYYFIIGKKGKGSNNEIFNVYYNEKNSDGIDKSLELLNLVDYPEKIKKNNYSKIQESIASTISEDIDLYIPKSSIVIKKERNSIEHSLIDLLSEEQQQIITVAREEITFEVGLEEFYEKYKDFIIKNEIKEWLNIHDFSQTLSMLDEIGIFTTSKIQVNKGENYLINLKTLTKWTLN